MNTVSLKTINCQRQQQHNHMPSNAGFDDNIEAMHVVAMPALAGNRIIVKKVKN